MDLRDLVTAFWQADRRQPPQPHAAHRRFCSCSRRASRPFVAADEGPHRHDSRMSATIRPIMRPDGHRMRSHHVEDSLGVFGGHGRDPFTLVARTAGRPNSLGQGNRCRWRHRGEIKHGDPFSTVLASMRKPPARAGADVPTSRSCRFLGRRDEASPRVLGVSSLALRRVTRLAVLATFCISPPAHGGDLKTLPTVRSFEAPTGPPRAR